MANIAIIGSGVNGLLAAHGLLQQQHKVSLYSARSAEDWLTKSRPTGIAARFNSSLELERELGLAHWEEESPAMSGLHLTFCHKPGKQLIDLMGRLSHPARAIDVRLQSHRWTEDFEAQCRSLIVGTVDLAGLDAIAAQNDLTIVASGRGELQELFARDEERSVYACPQRKLTMMLVRNPSLDRSNDGIPFTPIKFNFTAAWGEQFSIPFWHKDGFPCWGLLFEAKEGSPLDAFDSCNTGESVVERAKGVFRESLPWDYQWFKNAELADPLGWLKGAFTPVVRNPVGTLASGRKVMALGDTVNSLDPIGGQGANNGYRQVRVLLDAVASHQGSFDAEFMQTTFETFYESSGRQTNQFNNLLLEELTPAAQRLLIAQYGSDGRADNSSARQRLADQFINNFDDPNQLTNALIDPNEAKALIRREFESSPWKVGLGGLVKIAKGQIRQALGKPRTTHPLARMTADTATTLSEKAL